MKKVFFSIFAIFGAVLLLTGCGSSGKKVVCTADFDEQGVKYSGEIVAELDSDDKIKDVTATMTFEDSETADQMYSQYQMVISMIKGFAPEGTELPEITKSGKKVTISNFNVLEESMSEDEDSEKMIGMSKEDFIKHAESQEDENWTCK